MLIILILLIAIPSYSPTNILPEGATSTYTQITGIRPSISPKYAESLTYAILKASKAYGVKPDKIVAILAQESRFNLKAINKISKDYGIGQINIRTAKSFNINVRRLIKDLNYAVDRSVFIMADFKRMYGKKEKTWWSRYNSSSPAARFKYEVAVTRYL